MDAWQHILEQITGFFYGLAPTDFVIPIGMAFWACIFLLRLDEIDLSAPFALAGYLIFCTSSGIILSLAIPAKYIKVRSLKWDFLYTMVFMISSLLVWEIRKRKRSNAKKQLLQEKIKRMKDLGN